MAVSRHLFAYGTLMDPGILARACGYRRPGEPARLTDHVRCRIRGESYPAVAPRPGAVVEGVLYRDLPPSAWRRLDRFEGAEYRRRRLPVRCADGSILLAETYVASPALRRRLIEDEWDLQRFLARDRATFRRLLG